MSKLFNVIIVGAGPAGCVLGSRLNEDPKLRVLLLEAGGDDDPRVSTPATFTTASGTWRCTGTTLDGVGTNSS